MLEVSDIASHGTSIGRIPSGYVKIAMERSTMLFMGKLTISIGPFSIAILTSPEGFHH